MIFVFAMSSHPSVRNKLNVSMDEFLEDLRAAIQNRNDNLQIKEMGGSQLPPRPNHEKPKVSYSENSKGQSEDLNPIISKQSNSLSVTNIQKPLPDIPAEEPKVEVKRTPFKIQQHYTRQKVEERRLEGSDQNFSKIPIQGSPIPVAQTAVGGAIPKPEKTKPLGIISRIEPSELPKIEKNGLSDCLRYTDRDGAETLLSKSLGDGTYLVRPSKQFHRTLSVRQGDKVYHIGIKKDGDMLEMESIGGIIKFENLQELINHFKINPLVVKNKNNACIDIYLSKTLPGSAT